VSSGLGGGSSSLALYGGRSCPDDVEMRTPREVARGLLFDGEHILMIRWRDPVTGHEFLEPPGGSQEPGESYEDALRREIAEESGIAGVEVGDFVRKIRHVFTFAGEPYDCRERYFVCRLTGRERTTPVLDPVEQAGILGAEWVRVQDLVDHPAGYVEPPELLGMLRGLGRLQAG
jgi:8-oxo-dGTP pyrophosphatase MutT (NUDIX family)